MRASAPRTPQASFDRKRARAAISLSPTAAGCSTPMPKCSRRYDAAMARGDSDEIDELLRQAGLTASPLSTTRRCRRRRSGRFRSPSRRNAISAAPIATPSRASSAAPAKNMPLGGGAARRRACWSATPSPARKPQSGVSRRRTVGQSRRAAGGRPARARIGASPRRDDQLFDHHQRDVADRRRCALLRGVTASLSASALMGRGRSHDALRPFKDGRGSYDRVMQRVAPLLKMQRRMQVSARVTVTPKNLALRRTLDSFDRGRLSQRRLFADAQRAHRRRRNASGRSRTHVGRNDRRAGASSSAVRASATLSVRQHGQRHAGDPPRHAPALSVRRRRRLSRRFRRGRACRLPSLCRRRGRSDGLARRRHRSAPPGASGWPHGTCTGRSPADPVGRATSAAAAAITKSSGAAGRPATYIRGWLHYCLEAYLRLSTRPDGIGLEPSGTSYG